MKNTIFCELNYDFLRRFEVSKPQEIRKDVFNVSEQKTKCFVNCLTSCKNLLEICNLFDSSFYRQNWDDIIDCLLDSSLHIEFQYETYKLSIYEDNHIVVKIDGFYIYKFNSFKELKDFLKLI